LEIKDLISANEIITTDVDPSFYFKFTGIEVGNPVIEDDLISHNLMPHECRIRNMTYSSPIFVNVEYTKGDRTYSCQNYCIGRMPMMLGASKCWLAGKTEKELAKIKECPYDPRGYFIIKGVEKVVLIQEQISKNRIIIETDQEKNLCAQVTSSTLEKRTRTTLALKSEKFFLRHNVFSEDIPILVVFKAMGMETD